MAKTTNVLKAKPAPKSVPVKLISGLPANAVYTATGKLARAQHNADRHLAYSGKTVADILAIKPTVLTPADIKYDVNKGFIKLV